VQHQTLAERLRGFGLRWERSGSRQQIDLLQRRLAELELLFGEYDHRVKNNTQMILSILASAQRTTASLEARSALSAAARKVEALSRVQGVLQRAGHAQSLRCDEFLRELCKGVQDASPQRFALVVESEPHELPRATTLPLGLIVNELLTNAIKHGISPDHGLVRVCLKARGDCLELRVEDNGPGIDASDLVRRSSGLDMVRHLATQLHGSFHAHAASGAQCILRFRNPALKH
jgi:two-component sensor histidine kinase